MKKLFLLTALLAALAHPAFAADDITVSINGEQLQPEQPPVVVNNRTLVPVRAVCEAMGLEVEWEGANQRITIKNDKTYVIIEINCHDIEVNGSMKYIDAAPKIVNGTTCVPIRAVVEPFGAVVDWDNDNQAVIINVPEDKPEASVPPHINSGISSPSVNNSKPDETDKAEGTKPTEKPSTESKPVQKPESEDEPIQKPAVDDEQIENENESKFAFYAQPDEEWGFASNGRGYCWVCSYAMLISNILDDQITPLDIEQYNLDAGSTNGNYMAGHFGLAAKYNLKFVPAIDEDSEYFDRFDSSHRGATYFKAETEEDVTNALIEALERNPDGIMVRFEGYPHTIVATEYRDGEIYYNDPGALDMENVTFEDTVLGKRFELTDLTFVQAMEVK